MFHIGQHYLWWILYNFKNIRKIILGAFLLLHPYGYLALHGRRVAWWLSYIQVRWWAWVGGCSWCLVIIRWLLIGCKQKGQNKADNYLVYFTDPFEYIPTRWRTLMTCWDFVVAPWAGAVLVMGDIYSWLNTAGDK